MFFTSNFYYYRVIVRFEGISSHHALQELSCYVKVTVGGIIFGPPPLIIFIWKSFKLPDNLLRVLYTDISNGIPFLFISLASIWPLDPEK